MTNLATAEKREEMEFVPFGTEDRIKLNVAIVQTMICVPTRTGKTCSRTEALKFMMMCRSRRLNPFEGDAFLIGYDGKDGAVFSLITAHQSFLKRAELHPEFDGMRSGVIVEEDGVLKDLEGDFHSDSQKVVGGWAIVYFKNRKYPILRRLRLKRFQKQFGVWQDDPAGMVVKCAEADALRSSFPTMLGGLYMSDELPKHGNDVKSPTFDAPMDVLASAPQRGLPPIATIDEPLASSPEPSSEQSDKEIWDAVWDLMKEANVSEETVMNYLKKKGIAKPSQMDIGQLATSKIRKLASDWPTIKDEIASMSP